MHAYNQSLSYDQRMSAADIKGSIAFAKALQKSGIMNEHECSEIIRGLNEVKKEWEQGTFVVKPDDEDIHTANERRLSEIVGKDIGGKLHTGRSRNDQVATDMRIWLMEEADKIKGYLKDLIEVMANRGEKEVDVLMPGYTHLQVSRGLDRKNYFFIPSLICTIPLNERVADPLPFPSEHNPSDGPISCSPTPTLSLPT